MLIDVVVLGGPPFQEGANQTSLQTFDELSREKTVLYVARRFQESGLRRLLHRGTRSTGADLSYGLHQITESKAVLVLPPLVDLLPLVRPEFARVIVCRLIENVLRRILHNEFETGHPVSLISYWWMFPEVARRLPWSRTIFDVIDRHWGYDHLHSDAARARNFDLAFATAEASDVVVSVTSALAEELGASSSPVAVLPNGVDLRRVNNVKPSDLRRNNTAIYVGGWNDRIDFDLLLKVVQATPEWKFEFIGGAPDTRFSHLPNVEFLGSMPYDSVIRRLGVAKVGLLPFRSSEYTNASSFLKVLDYLACGLLVAATNLPTLRGLDEEYPEHLNLLDGIEQWDEFFHRLGSSDQSSHVPPDLHHRSVERRVAELLVVTQ